MLPYANLRIQKFLLQTVLSKKIGKKKSSNYITKVENLKQQSYPLVTVGCEVVITSLALCISLVTMYVIITSCPARTHRMIVIILSLDIQTDSDVLTFYCG